MGLAAALPVVCTGVIVSTAAMRGDAAIIEATPQVLPCPPGSEWQLRDLVNAFRVRHGAWALPLSAELTASAQRRADSMAARGRLDQTSLADGVQPGYTAIGANVTLDVSVASAAVSFERSPAQRATLLGAYTEMGLGIASDANGRVWVAQLFAQRSVPTPAYVGPAGGAVYRPVAPFVAFESPSRLAGATITTLQVSGLGGVPSDATSVVVTAEATKAVDRGSVEFLEPGLASAAFVSLPVLDGGRSTTTVAKLDGEGRLTVRNSVAAHLRVTVVGAFVPALGPASAGRLVTVDAARVATFALAAGRTTTVDVLGRAGVPRSGVLAVVLRLRATEGALLDVAGSAEGGLVIAPVDAAGRVVVGSDRATEVTVDVEGWFTDGTAAATTDGLYVAVAPGRVLDAGAVEPAVAGGRQVYVADRHDLPACPSAVVATIALVPELDAATAQLGPYRRFTPGSVPTLVAPTARVRAATTAFVATGDDGDLGLHTSQPARLTVDVTGWFV